MELTSTTSHLSHHKELTWVQEASTSMKSSQLKSTRCLKLPTSPKILRQAPSLL
uniref:Uncharacterized protein n=1 Tax=Rhizophora mucronata TaxID=61149 RepID=A0A2P2NHA4_RHIMU